MTKCLSTVEKSIMEAVKKATGGGNTRKMQTCFHELKKLPIKGAFNAVFKLNFIWIYGSCFKWDVVYNWLEAMFYWYRWLLTVARAKALWRMTACSQAGELIDCHVTRCSSNCHFLVLFELHAFQSNFISILISLLRLQLIRPCHSQFNCEMLQAASKRIVIDWNVRKDLGGERTCRLRRRWISSRCLSCF